MFKASRSRRGGQSLVEFALVTPLFLILIFGILEGGRLVWTHHTMTNATREGARYATVRGSGSTQSDAPAGSGSIKAHMLATSTGLAASDLSVNLVLLDGAPGWADVLARHDAEAIVWPTEGPLVELAREVGGWATVWADEEWVVLCAPDHPAC